MNTATTTQAAFAVMLANEFPTVTVQAIARRDDGDGDYDKVVSMGEFVTADLATKARKPKAHVRDWFTSQPSDVAWFEISGYDPNEEY